MRLLCNDESGKSIVPTATSVVGLAGKIRALRRHAEELYAKWAYSEQERGMSKTRE
jgi:hypothetical protein